MSKFSGLRVSKQPSGEMPVQHSELSGTQNVGLPESRKLGRPKAKRSDPDYTQVTAYIRKDTHLAVKKKLLDLGDMEFSDTLENLLREWLKAGRSI
jgi:hypothetical protein